MSCRKTAGRHNTKQNTYFSWTKDNLFYRKHQMPTSLNSYMNSITVYWTGRRNVSPYHHSLFGKRQYIAIPL